MKKITFGVLGAALLIGGLFVGAGGLALQVTSGCSTTYQLSLQPADSVADPSDETISYDSMTDYQQTAVRAALENQSVTLSQHDPLEPLTEAVIEVDDERYVAELIENLCQSLYDEAAVGGFGASVVGLFTCLYAVVLWRQS